MIRGTTPTHIFKLPIDTASIKDLRITYAQAGRKLVEKTAQDVTMEGTSIRLKLTQQETLRFQMGVLVRLQLKVLTSDGSVLACLVKDIPVEEILNEEVLS